MVAEAFLGPCPAGQEVRHKDGNTMNNKIENLDPFDDELIKKRKMQTHKDLIAVLKRKQLKKRL